MFPQKIKLRVTIFVGVLLITTGLAALLLLLNWLSSARTVRTFTRDLLDPVAHQVTEQTRDMLDSAASAAEVAAAVIGDVPAELRPNALDVVGAALLSSERALAYVQLGLPDGGWVRITRRDDGSLESRRRLVSDPEATAPRTTISRRAPSAPRTEILERTEVDASYDPRTRPWYMGAREAKGVFLTDAYAHFPDDRIVVTAAVSLRTEDGAENGVVSVAITLTNLAEMLARLRVAGRPIRGFVLDPAQGTLAAAGAAPIRAEGGNVTLPRLADTDPSVLRALARNPDFQTTLQTLEPNTTASIAYVVDGARQLAVVRPIAVHGREWVAGAVVAEDDFLGTIQSDITRSILISLGILGLFLAGAALLAKSIAGPLHAIAVETEHLRRFDFSERPLPHTIFEEIADVNGVFGSLKSGLRGFGKYVPLKLVQELLADGTEPVLGGRSEELSILFSDIHGFTGFSEEIGVADTAQVLGDYLAGIAGIVTEESGTVDKYIGDGMMAFWNAPRPVADHAERAVIAAIRCRDAIATMPRAERLRTRFGIHTDRVIVGNFGAPDRFDYTAIGDGVNLAARLERVNNEYGTAVIASDQTRRLAGTSVAWRRLDRIAVKGKRVPTEIHEALGLVGTIPESILAAASAYEAGLDAYFARDFILAVERFDEALRLRPDDTAAAILRERAVAYAASPPSGQWDGVQVMATK
jgi:adenylate cyclase